MKNDIYVIIASLFLILGFSFFIFNLQKNSIAGFAVYNESSENSVGSNKNMIVTSEDALSAINEAEEIIKEMQKNNFSVVYMNDILIEAKTIFDKGRYAKGGIDYKGVLIYTDEIKARKEKAFLLIDEITIEESKISPEEGELYNENMLSSDEEISEETKQILEQAKTAFYEDRYEDAGSLLEEFRNALEQEITEKSTLSGIKEGAKNFFQRYYVHVIIVLILFSIISYFVYKKVEKELIKEKIRKMKAENEVLMKLMKRTQEDRFKKNLISRLVYDIRMKKYGERLQEIKEELPVFEARLNKLRKNKANEITAERKN